MNPRLVGRYTSSFRIQITQIQNYPNTNGEKGIKWLNRAQHKTASNQSFLSLKALLILLVYVSFSLPHFISPISFLHEVSCQTREQLHSWSCISGTCLSRTAAFDFECSLFAFFPKFAIRNTLMAEISIALFWAYCMYLKFIFCSRFNPRSFSICVSYHFLRLKLIWA